MIITINDIIIGSSRGIVQLYESNGEIDMHRNINDDIIFSGSITGYINKEVKDVRAYTSNNELEVKSVIHNNQTFITLY